MNRRETLHKALYRGHLLTLENPRYLRTVESIIGTLAAEDCEPRDLTVDALFGDASSSDRAGDNPPAALAGAVFGARPAIGRIIAREPGVVAGVQEVQWLCDDVQIALNDGQSFERGDVILEIQGDVRTLLTRERIVLNVLQRMSGIATAMRRLRTLAPGIAVVGTRKTPWGLLDHRAVHLGGGGTHRLGLGDAILIKNNHLEMMSVLDAVESAWYRRDGAAFIEVEVRDVEDARIAATAFRRLQDGFTPCLLLLDNMSPVMTASTVAALRAEGLWDHVLIEASGNIDTESIVAYAASGVDAISVGALTHSVRALDLHQKVLRPKD